MRHDPFFGRLDTVDAKLEEPLEEQRKLKRVTGAKDGVLGVDCRLERESMSLVFCGDARPRHDHVGSHGSLLVLTIKGNRRYSHCIPMIQDAIYARSNMY